MLLDGVERHLSSGNLMQAVNRDDRSAENVIKVRTEEEINVFICKDREKKG